MSTLFSDVRHALRSLAKNRGFAVVAVLTIGLGVGANTAVFSVVNAVLLQPLPFQDAERLVEIYETARRATVERRSPAYLNFQDWQRETRTLESLAAHSGEWLTMPIGEAHERLPGELVSWNYFNVLGARPAIGRTFSARDDVQGAAPVIILSDALWEKAFGRDRDVIGRSVRVDDELATIIGVMPAHMRGLSDTAQLWAPVGRFADAPLLERRGERWLDGVVARLRPGVSLAQARSEMDAIAAGLEKLHKDNRDRGVGMVPLREEFFGDLRPMLLVLLGAVGFVLLIACVNVANLLLARGSARQRELAVRAALGAGRGRIVRQLLTESVALSVIGGIAGLVAAFWTIDLLVALSPIPFPTFVRIGVNLQVLAFTFAVCVLSGFLFGVAPALAASRTDLVGTLKAGGRDGADGGSPLLRKGLVTAEIALALVLLIGAGLMLRTMDRLGAFDPGFRPAGLLTLRVALPIDSDTDAERVAMRRTQFARTLLGRVGELPGVSDASLASAAPLSGISSATIARIDEAPDTGIRIYRHAVSPGYFKALGIPLLEGRDFTSSDVRSADQRVAIVSRTMAARHWPGRSALLKRFRLSDGTYQVIGVVGDVQHRSLLEPDSADPDIYFPMFQIPSRAFAVMARTSGDPEPTVAAIRQIVTELNPAVPVFSVSTGEELVAQQTTGVRFSSALLGAFALVALTLTMVGIYGVTAYTVSRQTRQVGIRMALGATRADVLGLILRGGATFIVAGLALGTFAAYGLTRLLSSLIYGVTATDPTTFAAVTALLALVAMLACLIPAARATRIDPVVALRSE
jgi:putative ABC transport system permease protein